MHHSVLCGKEGPGKFIRTAWQVKTGRHQWDRFSRQGNMQIAEAEIIAQATYRISVGQGPATVRLVTCGINSARSSSRRVSSQGLQRVYWCTLFLCGLHSRRCCRGGERHAKR